MPREGVYILWLCNKICAILMFERDDLAALARLYRAARSVRGRFPLSDPPNRCRRAHPGRYGNSQSSWMRAKLYLPFARHFTPASLQPLRVSLRKVLWWILTPEVLWRSLVLALMPDPRFPLRMLFATPTPWAPTSTMPARLPLSFFE